MNRKSGNSPPTEAPPIDLPGDETGQKVVEVTLTAESQDIISRRLREIYSAQLNEPVPDKFAALLDALAKKGS